MVVLKSIATGLWSAAGTWGLIDATSYNNTESTTAALTTSYQASAGSTTGAITVSSIGLKLSVRTGTTGTIDVHLAIAGVEVAGTLVTINVADLPVAATADLNGGWHFFKFASPVLLVGATSYTVEARTSSATQVSLFSTSGSNWARALVTTTTQAPAAGDDMIVAGAYTAAGTSSAYTVTMDNTAATDFGAASTSLVLPAIAICNKGILLFATAAATAYQLKVSGNVIGYSGGATNLATVATKMPANSSLDFWFDCGANVDFGFIGRNLFTIVGQGNPYSTDRCKLNTDEAANSTSLGIDTTPVWPDNAAIAVASTTRTATQCEAGTLNGASGAGVLTVDGFAGTAGGLLNAHSGTSPTQAEVILLTRNVMIRGASAALQAYIDIKATCAVDFDWVEFKWLGSAVANKRGIDTACTTGIQTFNNCSLRDFVVTGSFGLNMSGTSGTGLTFSDNVTWNINTTHLSVSPNSGSSIISNNIFMLNVAGGVAILADVGGTFTNNTVISSVGFGYGLVASEAAEFGNWSDIVVHSCNSNGFGTAFVSVTGVITNLTSWRNNGAGLIITQGDFTIVNLIAFGNNLSNLMASTAGFRLTLINPIFNGDTSFATVSGINLTTGGAAAEIIIHNGNFGTVSGIKTAHTQDIFCISTWQRIFLYNTLLASATEVTNQQNLSPGSFIASQKHDQTAGLHKTWKRYGTLTIDTATVHSPGAHSIQMTPINASYKLESSGAFGGFKVQVANGQTCTPTIFVQEDGTYNGNRARLIVKRNDAMGISADTVLDTATAASDAAWEGLTGTTAAVTDDGTLEFVIDCDGTAGNLYVASVSAVVA